MVLNCGIGEDSWESLDYKEIQPVLLKEISPGCSLEGLMLKLKLQYFGHLMQRVDLFEKTLMLGRLRAGGEGDDRGRDGWMASATWWTWVWVDFRSWWWIGRPGVLWFVRLQRVGHNWATELILNWLFVFVCVCSVVQSCLTLSSPMDINTAGSSAHGVFQERILDWVAIFYSRGSPQHSDRNCVSCVSWIGRRILYHCPTWEALFMINTIWDLIHMHTCLYSVAQFLRQLS